MQPQITRLTETTFRFEYINARELPKLMKGQRFVHEEKVYRVTHYHQVFGERVYCSFLVAASVVK